MASLKARINDALIRQLKTKTGQLAVVFAMVSMIVLGSAVDEFLEGGLWAAAILGLLSLANFGVAVSEFREWLRLRTTVGYIERRDERHRKALRQMENPRG